MDKELKLFYMNRQLKFFEESLVRYKEELEKKPDSFFFACLIKSTEEYISHLKESINEIERSN